MAQFDAGRVRLHGYGMAFIAMEPEEASIAIDPVGTVQVAG